MSPGVQSIAELTTEIRPSTGDIPPPLVGASTVAKGNYLYVFGGRLASSRQMTNHLYILDLTTFVWKRHPDPPPSATPAPQPRYFHSANIYKDYMIIFGGMGHAIRGLSQELCALDDICLLNLETLTWTYPEIAPSLFKPQPRYAHLSVAADDKLIIMGGQDLTNQYLKDINVMDLKAFAWVQSCTLEGQYGAYRSVACSPSRKNPALANSPVFKRREKDPEMPPVCVYSNYNFADLTRDLQVFDPARSGQRRQADCRDYSADMSGTALPPGLRFPTSYLLGHHMILTGTFLTPTHRSFQIWALNLANLVWTRIDTGSIFANGSWNRGVLAEGGQKFYVFGHRHRDMLVDYNHRQVNFDHVAAVDMEAFGIYIYPPSTCAPIAQELGLSMLNEPSIADVEIVTADKKTIPANSSILSSRWPYFNKLVNGAEEKNVPKYKTISFPETYAVTLAFLQYIYTDHLMTAQQYEPRILSRLLIMADQYAMPRLIRLATHALHQILTISTASIVYETAALTCQTALQVRALRVMINAKKMLQKQQSINQQPQDKSTTERNPYPSPPTALDRLTNSKSSRTTEPRSVTPSLPRMSKSGTMLSTSTHPPATYRLSKHS